MNVSFMLVKLIERRNCWLFLCNIYSCAILYSLDACPLISFIITRICLLGSVHYFKYRQVDQITRSMLIQGPIPKMSKRTNYYGRVFTGVVFWVLTFKS